MEEGSGLHERSLKKIERLILVRGGNRVGGYLRMVVTVQVVALVSFKTS